MQLYSELPSQWRQWWFPQLFQTSVSPLALVLDLCGWTLTHPGSTRMIQGCGPKPEAAQLQIPSSALRWSLLNGTKSQGQHEG